MLIYICPYHLHVQRFMKSCCVVLRSSLTDLTDDSKTLYATHLRCVGYYNQYFSECLQKIDIKGTRLVI